MFSLRNFLSTEKSHLPIGFDPARNQSTFSQGIFWFDLKA